MGLHNTVLQIPQITRADRSIVLDAILGRNEMRCGPYICPNDNEHDEVAL